MMILTNYSVLAILSAFLFSHLDVIAAQGDPLQEIRRHSANLASQGSGQGVAVHAEFDVREYLRSGDKAWADKAIARLQGISDAWQDTATVEKLIKGERRNGWIGHWFFERYPLYFVCQKLEKEKLLPDDLREKLIPLREVPKNTSELISSYERGANNRPFNYCGDALIEAINHPESPLAADYRKYAEVCWQDWIDLGSTPEVMPSYNRLFLSAILNLAELMDKEDELRAKMAGEFKRYFRQISGNGVRGGEAEAMKSLIGAGNTENKVPGWYVLDDIYSDPWAANCTIQYVNIAIKAARIFKDPKYVWYARTLLANGDIPDEQLSPEAKTAIAERLGEFDRDGTKMKIPNDTSFVSFLPFRSGSIADRLVLMPQRAGTGPFAAFYVYDRMEGFMHGVSNQVGRLYEFSIDGSLLLRQGGKYSQQPHWENTIIVMEPWKRFPSPIAGSVPNGRWTTATASLLTGRSRWQQDNEYVFDPTQKMPFAKLTNPFPAHRLWGNYNVFTHAGDSTLTSLPLQFSLIPKSGSVWGSDITNKENTGTDKAILLYVENLRLIGPKGEKLVCDPGKIGEDVEIVFTPPTLDKSRFNKKFEQFLLKGEERDRIISVVEGSKPGIPALRISLKPGTTSIKFPITEKFDLVKDYTRVSLDYRYDGDTSGWSRLPIGLGEESTGWWQGEGFAESQGAIQQSVQVLQQGGDSLGIMEFGNVWTSGTQWRRRALLTKEGVMLVCDDIIADKSADGWNAGPLWHLAPDWKNDKTNEKPVVGENWVDAPAFNRAVWQKNPKRLLLWFKQNPGMTTGMEKQDTVWNSSYAVWQKDLLNSEEAKRFISILVPHDASTPPGELVRKIKVESDGNGLISMLCGPIKISLSADDKWWVTR